MARSLVSFLVSQKREGDRIPVSGVISALDDRLGGGWALPLPYRIYSADETLPPRLGFPVARHPVFDDLADAISEWLDSVLADRAGERTARTPHELLASYTRTVSEITENAMISNFLADYHAIFWLAHSLDVAKTFGSFRSRLAHHGGTMGGNPARLLRRIFEQWSEAVAGTLEQVAEQLEDVLDDAGAQVEFFRLLESNALIFLSVETDPDFRGARDWLEGRSELRFREVLETLDDLAEGGRTLAAEDAGFAWSLESIGCSAAELDRFKLLEPALRNFLAGHPALPDLRPEIRAAIDDVAGRLLEFEVLRRLRSAIEWTEERDGAVWSLDSEKRLSESTRPLRFDKPGVVDPIVHRFGLVYDLAAFSETLGEIARRGVRQELVSYRQMFRFQKQVDRITTRNRLKFEKFLGDGAFYTTRHALGLIRSAIDVQQYYARMRSEGFLFDRGLRIALNYGYYRLLPINDSAGDGEPLIEFFGPGIVELSRLTTGKATRDVEDFAQHLISSGYGAEKVSGFFAPLIENAESNGEESDGRSDFYAHLDRNRNLVNEGIVASWSLVDELARELIEGSTRLHRAEIEGGRYVAFDISDDREPRFAAIRALGFVNLKGLPGTEVAEIVRAEPGQIDASPLDDGLVTELRRLSYDRSETAPDTRPDQELTVCSYRDEDSEIVVIGRLDREIDTLHWPVRITSADLAGLLGAESPLEPAVIERSSEMVTDLYRKLAATELESPFRMEELRKRTNFRMHRVSTSESRS